MFSWISAKTVWKGSPCRCSTAHGPVAGHSVGCLRPLWTPSYCRFSTWTRNTTPAQFWTRGLGVRFHWIESKRPGICLDHLLSPGLYYKIWTSLRFQWNFPWCRRKLQLRKGESSHNILFQNWTLGDSHQSRPLKGKWTCSKSPGLWSREASFGSVKSKWWIGLRVFLLLQRDPCDESQYCSRNPLQPGKG